MRQILWGFLLILSFNVVQAATPFVCSPIKVGIHEKNILLPGTDSNQSMQIYFLKNVSQQSIWLDHSMEHRSASAGWSSYLRTGKWSAILLNRKNFSINCAVIKPGKLEYLNCAKVITVCAPPQFIYRSKRNGSYWLAEDKSWDELLAALKSRGVKFK